jgi:hypothetical protein
MLDELHDSGPKFHWKCSVYNCSHVVKSWTGGGMRSLRAIHEEQHDKQAKLLTAKFDQELRRKPPVNYNKLILSLHDINMFEQHHIKIDEGCVIDGFCS